MTAGGTGVLADFGFARDFGLGDISSDGRLAGGSMAGKAERHLKNLKFIKHRGFSLDWLQPMLNPDSFKNSFTR